MIQYNKIKEFLRINYRIEPDKLTPIQTGVGGDTFFVESKKHKFIYKIVKAGGMNHPESEPNRSLQRSKEEMILLRI